ncbi:MAG: hypothetical protein GTO18_15800 [Anaerolineales bacterium]|nr:hypothetical protein [Anaerolineales bacterium]
MGYSRRSHIIGLALLSAGMLVFEITLTRLFAIQQFHHFAFVVVSLAVMGIAGSGLLLTIRPKLPNLSLISFGFVLSIILAYFIINVLPFDSYSITWDHKQLGILILYFAAAGLPFLLAGWIIGVSLLSAGRDAYFPYAANLIGASVGCLVALISIALIGGERTILLSCLLGILAALAFAKQKYSAWLLVPLILVLLAIISFPRELELQLSPYKPLSIFRLVPDARETESLWSHSTRLDVLETNTVHSLPGLSLNASTSPPRQAAIFLDGDGPIPITDLSSNDPDAASIAEYMPFALAYQLRPNANALILQPGGGLDPLLALALGADSLTLSSDEPLIEDVLQGSYSDLSHHLFEDPRIRLSDRSSRGTLVAGEEVYDIIHFSLSDSYRPVTSGAFSLTENYLLTVEAIRQALDRLDQEGLLLITRWLGTPPSETARAWSTLIRALMEVGLLEPDSHLIAFRGMRTATMIASLQPFSNEELDEIRAFLEANGFDPIHLPDLNPNELNRHNQLPSDSYYELYKAILEDQEQTLTGYSFNLRPPTDDRPYFFHFFRWRQTPEVLAMLGQIWLPFGGSGYLVLLALLGLMILLALPFALGPLFLRSRNKKGTSIQAAMPLYFAFLGAGYLLIEIPLIQKMTLLLDRPAIALATVLFSMLLASGLGSLISRRIPLRTALIILIGYLFLLVAFLPEVITFGLPWNEIPRVIITVIVIAPAGFLMGIPFASGIRALEERSPGSIPWAWAINGAISGIIGVAAAMIALDLGISAALAVGALAYLGAFFTAPMRKSEGELSLRT